MKNLKLKNNRDRQIKILSIFNILVLLISIFSPIISFILPVVAADSFKEIELTDLRTETSRIFQTGPKDYRYEETLDKIFYKNGNQYDFVDNTIVSTGKNNPDDEDTATDKYAYKNKANDFTIYAGKHLKNGFLYTKGNQTCHFRLVHADKNVENNVGYKNLKVKNVLAQVSKNKIVYPDVYKDINLEVSVFSDGIKTELVGKDENVPVANFPQSIEFELIKCDSKIFNKAVAHDDKIHVILSESKIIREDSDENSDRNLPKNILKINPDYSRFANKKGNIRVDPSIINSSSIDVFVSEDCTGNWRRFLAIGDWRDSASDVWCGRAESYLKFDLNLPGGAFITSSELSLKKYQADYGSFNVKVARITGSGLNPNTGSVLSNYFPKTGEYTSKTINSGNIYTEGFLDFRLDMKNMVQEWTNGTPNFGLAVYGDSAHFSNRGAAFCSSRSDGFCTDAQDPKLIINYTVNQPPYTPGPVSPNNFKTYSGNCDESVIPVTGICRTTIPVTATVNGVGDGDPAPGDLRHTVFNFNGSNNFDTNPIGGSGTVSYTGNFNDGNTNWKARSLDNLNVWGQFSASMLFTTDTTPPNVPTVNRLPLFTKAVGIDDTTQIGFEAVKTTDNVSSPSNIFYQTQYSKNADFSLNYQTVWQQDNSLFQIGPKGIDQIAGTEDDISDGNTYYLRVKAKDGLGNISNWSQIQSTTIDGKAPDVSKYTVSDIRFSPNNSTSTGYKDTVDFEIEYSEKNSNKVSVNIYADDKKTNLVKTFDITNINCDNNNLCTQKITWDGKNNSNADLSDGLYSAYLIVTDLAGNETVNTSPLQIIIDNTGANISISQPADQIWIKDISLEFKGQVTAPRDVNKQDTDVDELKIKNEELTIDEPISFDSLGFFTKIMNVIPGQNLFTFTSTDTVGNKVTAERKINVDQSVPIISNVLPNSLTKEKINTIKFDIIDPDRTNDRTQTSDIPSGVNPKNMHVWMSYITLNTETFPFTPKVNSKELINDGVNLDTALVGNLTCNPSTNSITSNKNGLAAANSLNCSLPFVAELQLDATYTIHISLTDIAGNVATKEDTSFQIDSHLYSEMIKPTNGGIYSTTSVIFKGKASKNSELKIQNIELGIEKTFILNEALNNTGKDNDNDPNRLITSNFLVTCGEYKNLDSRDDTPDEEVCTWEVNVLQKYESTNVSTTNHNIISIKDSIGNLRTHEKTIIVNLYKFDLNISTDLIYFSPNGDGNQDDITFTHTATNPTDPISPPQIASYKLEIKDANGQVIKNFTGTDQLPLNTFWDGRDSNPLQWLRKYVPDGDYKYTLSVTTVDGITIATEPQPLYAKTKLENEVIITNPKTGYVTTNGVITIQGQAPTQTTGANIFRGRIYVDLCIDTLGTNTDCDLTVTVRPNKSGFFSTLIVLPRKNQSQTIHNITAIARDAFGNHTGKSNLVQIIQDTIDPFTKVSITPALTGVNTQEDYDKFLRGEISIDKLRTLVLHAEVTKNTEQLQYSFSEYINLIQRPANPNYRYIATVNDKVEESARLNPYALTTIKENYNKSIGDPSIPVFNCNNTSGCTWETYLPAQPTWGGTYEVEFKAKKGDIVQSLTAGFQTDGAVAAAPYMMIIEYYDANKKVWIPINQINGTYFTNKTKLRIRGAADPNIQLELLSNGQNTGINFTANEFGVWEANLNDVSTLISNCKQLLNNKCGLADFLFQVRAFKTDSVGNRTYEILSSNKIALTYDIIAPTLKSIVRTTPEKNVPGWVQSGTSVQYTVNANENLSYADLVKEDGYVELLASTLSTNPITWLGSINADREAEGFYNPKINIMDYAGNRATYDSQNVDSVIGDWRIYIDNTVPDETYVNQDTWGENNGIKADGVIPSQGRTNPEYVIRGNNIILKGKAEKNQRVEVWVNKNLVSTINVTNNNCAKDWWNKDKVTKDGLVVRYKDFCDWSYTYTFTDNGANDEFGVPLNYAMFQVRTVDGAMNLSDFSDKVIVYHDTVAPKNPEIFNISSNSYNPIPDWGNRAIITPITKDTNVNIISYAERFADMEYWKKYSNLISGSSTQKEHRLFENSSNRKSTQAFSLGADQTDDRNGCVQIQGNRRIGICNDGNYTFSLKATDAAGNGSQIVNQVVERDTVRPEKASVQVSKSGDIASGQTLSINISGESNATAKIVITNSNNFRNEQIIKLDQNGSYSNSNILKLICGVITYTATITVIDRAGNNSETVSGNVISLECPKCFSKDGKLLFPVDSPKATIPNGSQFQFGADRIDKNGNKTLHLGVDINGAGIEGSSVVAAASGTISAAFYESEGYGNVIYINHGNGLQTRYAHMMDDPTRYVKEGDVVNAGQQIGRVGTTGNSTGFHLHFEVRINGIAVDPVPYLGSGGNIVCESTGSSGGNSSSDPYDGKTPENIGTAQLEFVHKGGAFGNRTEFMSSNIPVPVLTSVTTDDTKIFKIYGVSIKKNAKAHVRLYEEKCDWVISCHNELKEEKDIEIQNLEVKAWKTELFDQQIYQAWDGGQFFFDKKIPGDINADQDVYAKTIIYGDFSCFDGLTCDYRSNHNESGKSNKIRPKDIAKNIGNLTDLRYDAYDTSEYTADVVVIPYEQDNICIKAHVGLKPDFQNRSGDDRFQAKEFKTLSTENTSKYNNMYPVAGINADLYAQNPDRPIGANIEEGSKYYSSSKINNNYWAFLIDQNKNISFQTNGDIVNKQDVSNLNGAAGFYYYYKDGQYRDASKNPTSDDTISVAGIVRSENQNLIITITKSGKFFSGNGVSISDTLNIFKKYGTLTDAIIFDSGGSPSIYYNNNGQNVYKNTNYDIISGLYFYKGDNCKK